ncbi:zinc finger, HIT domain containing 1, isoform CRA_a, partial [Mus musculus]
IRLDLSLLVSCSPEVCGLGEFWFETGMLWETQHQEWAVRSQDPGQRRVLDRAARQRRINRQLEALENDNFQDDPHAGLPQLGKRLPQFDDDADTGKKKKKTRGDHFKLRFRKNFQALLEEQNLSASEGPNYLTACAGPPSRPQRPFCAVCGFPSPYTCVSCGARYCTVRCLGTHQETRCLKWTV